MVGKDIQITKNQINLNNDDILPENEDNILNSRKEEKSSPQSLIFDNMEKDIKKENNRILDNIDHVILLLSENSNSSHISPELT